MEEENCSFLALLMAPDESPVENPYEIQTPPPEFEPDYISFNQTPPQAENYFFSPLPVPVQVSKFNNLNPVYKFDNFSVLPSLLSLETHFPESLPPPPFKIPKLESSHPSSPPPPPPPPPPLPQFDDYSLGSILNECTKKSIKNERKTTTTAAEKTKRVRIRDSMYELSKLMPAGYGRKKTMAEMLEVACKYVKFLQAQVNALECMPEMSRLADGGGDGGGRLRRLTRQQLLQVAVNSEEMQVVMADNGLCLVSEEQIVQFRRVEMRSKIVQQLLAHIPI